MSPARDPDASIPPWDHPPASLPAMRPGADLPIGLVDERALPALRLALRPGRAGILHRGDVLQLCPGHPVDRAVDPDRIPAAPLVDAAAARLAGHVDLRPP